MRIEYGDSAWTPLPEYYYYDEETKTLLVEWTDNSVICYFDVPSTSIFLIEANSRRHRDFLAIKSKFKSTILRAALPPGEPYHEK